MLPITFILDYLRMSRARNYWNHVNFLIPFSGKVRVPKCF